MEHRRRTLSSVLDEDILDLEKEIPRKRINSASLDEQIDEYTEFMYNGTFDLVRSILKGFINLIYPCLSKSESSTVDE